MKTLLVLLVFYFACFPTWGAEFFIKSLKAPLLKEAKNGSEPLTTLERGTKVDGGSPEGAFVAVTASGAKGFINKLFLSDKPLAEKASLLNQDVDISSKARKRASGFTSAAAARGLKEDSDQIFKNLGKEANATEFKKLETFLVSDKDGLEFIQDVKKELKP